MCVVCAWCVCVCVCVCVGGCVCVCWGIASASELALKSKISFFFSRRTALKDSPQGPPTANRQPPPTVNHHQPPTTNRQPPTFEVEKVP